MSLAKRWNLVSTVVHFLWEYVVKGFIWSFDKGHQVKKVPGKSIFLATISWGKFGPRIATNSSSFFTLPVTNDMVFLTDIFKARLRKNTLLIYFNVYDGQPWAGVLACNHRDRCNYDLYACNRPLSFTRRWFPFSQGLAYFKIGLVS